MPLEKYKLKEALTREFDAFIQLFSAFDESKINQKPQPASWSPAQVAVHIIKATDGVPDNKTKPLDREVDALLPAIRPWWEDLNQKFQSPEPLKPEDKSYSKTELVHELQRVKEKDLAIIQHADLTLICLDLEVHLVSEL